MGKKKIRPLGDILLDLEVILDEMIDSHDLQWGDVRSLVMQHLKTHRPDAQEQYVSGGNPVDYYGPKEFLKADESSMLLFEVWQEYKVGRPRRQWKDLMDKVEQLMKEKTNG
jgi:hypothetical protein